MNWIHYLFACVWETNNWWGEKGVISFVVIDFCGATYFKTFWLKRQKFWIDVVNSINLSEVLKRMTPNIWSDSFALKSSLFYYCCCFIIWWAQSCLMRMPMEILQKTDRAPQRKTWVDVWDCCINFLALPVSSRMASFSLWSIRLTITRLREPEKRVWNHFTVLSGPCSPQTKDCVSMTTLRWDPLLAIDSSQSALSAEGGSGDKERFNSICSE